MTILNGSPLNDIYNGGDGDDILNGGPGADNLNGGGGFDTAVFTGNQADYIITSLGLGNWTVQHIAMGSVDSLSSIERLQFDDSTVPRSAAKGRGPGAARTQAELNSVVAAATNPQQSLDDATGAGSTQDTETTAHSDPDEATNTNPALLYDPLSTPVQATAILSGNVLRIRAEISCRFSGTAQAVRCRKTGGLAPYRFLQSGNLLPRSASPLPRSPAFSARWW